MDGKGKELFFNIHFTLLLYHALLPHRLKRSTFARKVKGALSLEIPA